MGKAPRRRAVSMDNNTKYLKSKGRIRGKRAGRPVLGPGSAVMGLQNSTDVCSSPQKCLPGSGGASGADGDFDTWSDLHSRASSSASTLSGRLSPILAEGEPEEPEGGLSCSSSPQLYPSPTSARSPAVGAGKNCPPLEQLPQLANLTATISLDEHLMENGYRHHQPPQHHQHSSVGRHKQQAPYLYSSAVKSPYSAGGYGATGMGIICHHSPMQTIQENKPTSFSGIMHSYSSPNALQSLLTAGQQYCSKGVMQVQERESHSLMGQASKGVGSNHHSQHPGHSNGRSHNGPPSHSLAHSLNRTHAHNHSNVTNHNSPHGLPKSGHNLSHRHTPVSLTSCDNGSQLHTYNQKTPYLYSPPSHAHLPASTTLPPNPASMLGMPQDSCYVATAPHPRHNHFPGLQLQGMTNGPCNHGHGVGNGTVSSNYHGYHQSHLHERLPADLDIDMFHGSLDCDVESILLHDIMDSGEEMDFNFDSSLSQGVGMGMGVTMGMGMAGFPGPQQTHSNQSWVSG